MCDSERNRNQLHTSFFFPNFLHGFEFYSKRFVHFIHGFEVFIFELRMAFPGKSVGNNTISKKGRKEKEKEKKKKPFRH